MASLLSIMSLITIFFIKIYKNFISPYIGLNCRFYPTCSNYSIYAIHNLGFLKGMILIIKRVIKCHPMHQGGYDPIPNKVKKHLKNREKK